MHPIKKTVEDLKLLPPPQLRVHARNWGVDPAGKKAADMIREILVKQSGAKAVVVQSKSTVKPGVPSVSRPPIPTTLKAVAKAPLKAAPIASKAAPVAKAAPAKLPEGTKAASPEIEAKTKALVASEFKKLAAPLEAQLRETNSVLKALRADFEELKSLAQTVIPEEASEEGAESEAGEEGMELTEEIINDADMEQLKTIASQIGLETTGKEKEAGLRAKILAFVVENSEEVPAPGEEAEEAETETEEAEESSEEAASEESETTEEAAEEVDVSWVKQDVDCLVLDSDEWKPGYVTKMLKDKAEVFVPNVEDPSVGEVLTVELTLLAPMPPNEGEEVLDEDAEEAEEEAEEEDAA